MPLPLKKRGRFPKPTPEYVSSLIEAATAEFAERDVIDARRDALFWQENPIPHPSHVQFEPVHMGVATEVINRLIGILDDFPRVQVYTTAVRQLTIHRATKVEDFSNTIFKALMQDRDDDVWRLVLEDTLRFGRGYDQLLYVPHRWSDDAPDFPKRKDGQDYEDYGQSLKRWKLGAKIPMHWRHLPARNVFMWHDDYGVSECLAVTKRRVKDLLSQYDLPNLQKYVQDSPNMQHSYALLSEYWSRDWGAYWASMPTDDQDNSADTRTGVAILRDAQDGELAEVFQNMYGYVPIVETTGLMSSATSRARRQMSVVDHMMPICEYLDQLVSQKASAVRVWAWPTPYFKNLGVGNMNVSNYAVEEDGRPVDIEVEPGKMFTLLPGEDIGWLVAPESGAGADELIALIQNQADALGISSAMFSANALGSNGYLYNSVMNAIRSKYSPVLEHIKNAHNHRTRNALQVVEMVGEPLYIFKHGDGQDVAGEWITLSPKDISEHIHQIDVHYEDHLPTDDAGDIGMALSTTGGEQPLMSRNTAREKFLRMTDPEREEKRIRVQKWLDSEPIQQMLITRSAAEAEVLMDEEVEGIPLAEALAGVRPEELALLPPELLMALGIDPVAMGLIPPQPGQMMGGPPAGVGSTPLDVAPPAAVGASLAAPSAYGGIAGAPASPVNPGIDHSMVPAPPAPSRAPKPKEPPRPAGRARGFSRKPARQKRPNRSS